MIIKTLKKLLQLIFNRIFYVTVALLVQLGWIFILFWRLKLFQYASSR